MVTHQGVARGWHTHADMAGSPHLPEDRAPPLLLTMCLFNKSGYDFFADLNLTSGISSNSFYWFLCDVGAIHISYFYRAHPGQCNGTFSLVRGPIGTPKGPQMAKNDNFGAIRGCCGSALAEQCGIKVEQVRALITSYRDSNETPFSC